MPPPTRKEVKSITKQFCTLTLEATSQSVTVGDTMQLIGGLLGITSGVPLGDQTVTLSEKVGTGAWTEVADSSSTTNDWGVISWPMPSQNREVTVWYKATFAETSTYEGATSNVIGVNYENIESTPRLTTLGADWDTSTATVAPGTITYFAAKLFNGQQTLPALNVTVWLWTGTTWVSYLTLKTDSSGTVKVPVVSETAGSAFLLATFAQGVSSYAGSKSNLVQLVWT